MSCARMMPMSIKKYVDKTEDLSGKKIIVTGGTSGIGLSLVHFLLQKHAKVVILARNMEKANNVTDYLLNKYQNAVIELLTYDQSDDESVKKASQEILEKHSDFYALFLNAGIVQRKKPTKYVDDYPLTIKTNYVGLALFLKCLLPNLSGQHRFIFQGSLVAGYRLKKIKSLKDKDIGLWQQYYISKAGVETLFYHYSHSEYPFEFLLVEPGIAITGIVRDFSSIIQKLARLFAKVFSQSADKAALTALLAVQSTTKNHSFIVPRGLFTLRGYPKLKKFSKKRMREKLYHMLDDDYKL